MWLSCLLIIFLTANSLEDSFDFEDAEIHAGQDWDFMESFNDDDDENQDDVDDDESDESMPQFKAGLPNSAPIRPLRLPASVRIPASKLYKDLFKPGKGSGPVPPLVQSILLPVPARPPAKPKSTVKTVQVLCYLDRMYVRVQKSLFTSSSPQTNLKLGTCAVNKATATHFYFLYPLKGCGIKRGEDANIVTFTNTLFYRPVMTGLIVREIPFTVPIRCTYTKFHRSYQTGFLPKITGGTFYRGLQNQLGPTINVMDASWTVLQDYPTFVIGKPVCFEATDPSSGTNQQLYLNSCYVTSSTNPFSSEKYSVVENYGCLVDSKNSDLTKFYTSSIQTVRFCVAAFLFKTMVSQSQSKQTMFMHCDMDLGPKTPTPSTKSCTYDAKSKTWTELRGDSSVCDCCESTCPAPLVATGKTITSKSWDLKLEKEVESMLGFSSPGPNDFELFWESDKY